MTIPSYFKSPSWHKPFPAQTLALISGIHPRTLARRKQEARFPPNESERLMRIALLFNRAVDVLGAEETARDWLKTPNPALGGQTPLAFADTEPGVRHP